MFLGFNCTVPCLTAAIWKCHINQSINQSITGEQDWNRWSILWHFSTSDVSDWAADLWKRLFSINNNFSLGSGDSSCWSGDFSSSLGVQFPKVPPTSTTLTPAKPITLQPAQTTKEIFGSFSFDFFGGWSNYQRASRYEDCDSMIQPELSVRGKLVIKSTCIIMKFVQNETFNGI